MTAHDLAILHDATSHEDAVLREGRETMPDIAPVSLEDRLAASVWFGQYRPEFMLLDAWMHRGECRVSVCLKHPAIGDEPATEIFRRTASSDGITFEHIATNPNYTERP